LTGKNPFFRRLEISSTEKNCLNGFAKFHDAVWTVFLASRKMFDRFSRFVAQIRTRIGFLAAFAGSVLRRVSA
jgi:hypothetical protein